MEPSSPTLQADSLPAEPQAKPKNTGVGSLPLLPKIFPTQELDQGVLLHCRQILYQLSYQGLLFKKKTRQKMVLVRMWRNWKPGALLVGMQSGAATVENSMAVPQKIKSIIKYHVI